ncbi:hypothetical protein ACFL3S_00040 [Gemmatimonadota bacterium]
MTREFVRSVFLPATLFVVLATGSVPTRLGAQLVQVKTVPVAAGDQFLLFPSQHLGMGSVSLAMHDTLGDPFSNPATLGRLRESIFFGSPTFYHISGRNGSGRSLPLGTFFTSGEWFGGGTLSLQELEGADTDQIFPFVRAWPQWDPPQLLSEESARNLYASALLGRQFPEKGLSIAASIFWADMNAVDGVDLLYALSQEIEQSGNLMDLRLGVLKEWEGNRSLELVLLHNRFRMKHDVSYLDLVWEPIPPDTFPVPQWETRIEKNLDHTDTWGLHGAYQRPLGDRGWRMGWSFTGNKKTHPKIPNYEIMNIPRDPGDTWAFDLGVGLAQTNGPVRWGVDLVLEPIWSETWAEAAFDTLSVNGVTIPAGAKTVENDFQFTNAHLNAGIAGDYQMATFQAGLQLRSYGYDLDQYNHIEAMKRDQKESWMEWTPSFGVGLHLPGATVRYAVRFTTGTGRPGTEWTGARGAMLDQAASNDFLVAPSGPLTLQDARVTTHQLSVVVPIR